VLAPSLAIHKQPSSTATSGVQLDKQPELELHDPVGSREGVAVTASLAPGTAVLSGTVTVLTDKKGHAKFGDLAITGLPGQYTLEFTADGFAPVTSDAITLQP
jgi:hypothetical protein